MKCPKCRGALMTIEFDRVEIDCCDHCGGIWLDSGELEALRDREGRSDSLLVTMRPGGGKESRRRCPICLKRMDKVFIGNAEPVLLDQCPDHGLWFDRGELTKVLSEGCADSHRGAGTSGLLTLLDEIFASDRHYTP
ncbi:MAG TPA: zf-TFIIB domain-containing protein [Deltaproteobacteria bacterium]|nr:zf-TFIIB domain-containing protein [Deltaproteobacteria bacterium]HOI06642.1 zf-TFIIB domain-containing protein [Deltaproteobacteria bacterium]